MYQNQCCQQLCCPPQCQGARGPQGAPGTQGSTGPNGPEGDPGASAVLPTSMVKWNSFNFEGTPSAFTTFDITFGNPPLDFVALLPGGEMIFTTSIPQQFDKSGNNLRFTGPTGTIINLKFFQNMSSPSDIANAFMNFTISSSVSGVLTFSAQSVEYDGSTNKMSSTQEFLHTATNNEVFTYLMDYTVSDPVVTTYTMTPHTVEMIGTIVAEP